MVIILLFYYLKLKDQMHDVRSKSPCMRTRSKTQQNIELMTFALTWSANILSFFILSIKLRKKKKICTWEVFIISHIRFTNPARIASIDWKSQKCYDL